MNKWWHDTWSPITGCTPVSEGCAHCYAARMAKRLAGRFGYPDHDPFREGVVHHAAYQPEHWRKPRRIFVCSMGDLFHDAYSREDVLGVFTVMRENPQHTYMVLTKRPEEAQWLRRDMLPPRFWLGV